MRRCGDKNNVVSSIISSECKGYNVGRRRKIKEKYTDKEETRARQK